jgi:hypothetical protein
LLGAETTRPALSGWPIEALGEGEGPQAPSDVAGDGSVRLMPPLDGPGEPDSAESMRIADIFQSEFSDRIYRPLSAHGDTRSVIFR